MADFTRGSRTDAIAHQHVTHQNSVYGSAITPTAGALWAQIVMHHGFIEEGTNTDPGSFYVQATLETTADDKWVTVAQFTTTDAATASEAISGSEAIGQTVIEVASTTGFAANDYIYIQDTTTPTDSEWHQIDIITGTPSIDIIDGLEVAKDSADVIFSDAEHFTYQLDLSGWVRWRVIYKHEGTTGMNTAIHAEYIEVTDIE